MRNACDVGCDTNEVDTDATAAAAAVITVGGDEIKGVVWLAGVLPMPDEIDEGCDDEVGKDGWLKEGTDIVHPRDIGVVMLELPPAGIPSLAPTPPPIPAPPVIVVGILAIDDLNGNSAFWAIVGT